MTGLTLTPHTVLPIVIPSFLLYALSYGWRPTTAGSWTLRATLYPGAVLTYALGQRLAWVMHGWNDWDFFWRGVQGWSLLVVVGGLIVWPIARPIARRKFSTPATPAP